jgi:zinc protease
MGPPWTRVLPLVLFTLVACGTARRFQPLPAPPATYPAQAPAAAGKVHLALPQAQSVLLPGGVTLVLAPDHRLPTFDFVFSIPGGDAVDPSDKPGLGTLAAMLANEGSQAHPSAQWAAAVEGLGAHLSLGSDREAFEFRGSATAGSADQLLALFVELWRTPALDPGELEKLREREMQKLTAREAEPTYLASRAMYQALFPQCQYGLYDLDRAFLASARLEDLKAHYQAHVATLPVSGALFVAYGDFDPQALKARLEALFRDAPRASEPVRWTFDCSAAPRPEVILVDRPGSAQSVVMVGRRSMAMADPQRPVLSVLNEVMGGGPSRRLFVRLREELGLTYGAYSHTEAYGRGGLWSAHLATRTERTGEALKELLAVAAGLAGQAVPEAELGRVRDYLAGSFVLENQSPGQLLARIASVHRYGLPPDYWQRYLDAEQDMDAGRLLALAQRDLPFEREGVIVVVGDVEKIRPQLVFLPADRVRVVGPQAVQPAH